MGKGCRLWVCYGRQVSWRCSQGLSLLRLAEKLATSSLWQKEPTPTGVLKTFSAFLGCVSCVTCVLQSLP